MRQSRSIPVDSVGNLRLRVERLFRRPALSLPTAGQRSLYLVGGGGRPELEVSYPSRSIGEFLNFISSAVPGGEIYLFGGVLRDLAMFGRRGFDSDIDVVVNGGWSNCVDYLEKLGATRNKFGGYRFRVGTWPVDIWNARETWAIAQGFVQYRGIESLLETTVLNWDAILMNWRTKTFVLKADYFEAIRTGLLDVVLEVNPNPLGMAVRVFRHLCLKNAKLLTPRAANYLCRCAATYQYREILASEMKSYGNSFIPESLYAYFAAAGKGNGDFGGGGETVEQNIVLKSLNLN